MEEFSKVVDYFKTEIAKIRSSRPSIELIEDSIIEAYGAKNKLKSLAHLRIAGARDLIIEPFDKTLLREIESSLLKGGIGLQAMVEGDYVHVIFPPLTQESRGAFVKLLNKKTEEARVRMRYQREKLLKKLEAQKKEREISEDQKFKRRKEIEKIFSEFTQKLEKLRESKEREIME